MMADGKLAEVVWFRTCRECGKPIKTPQKFTVVHESVAAWNGDPVVIRRYLVHYKCFDPVKHMKL
jgi:hypothetical protein